MKLDFIRNLVRRADTKIVLLVMDGLGGLPRGLGEPSELEVAKTPHLDELAVHSLCGLHLPVAAGITPGSGPSHLALFGYDPTEYTVGRGVLSALGIDFDLQERDVAVRGNFCTLDPDGNVTDRRAGRISTAQNMELCRILSDIELPEAEVFVETVKDYRFLLVLRGEGLSERLADTDPQATGVPPGEPKPGSEEALQTARLVDRFVKQAAERLAERHPANMILLRGFARRPEWPDFKQVFGLKAAAIAGYPMYRGLGRLLGMTGLVASDGLDEKFAALKDNWKDFDFFYLHVKQIDSAGEDGNFDRKVELIEEVDQFVPRLLDMGPDVLMVTGDHSTPSSLRSHSWHPVPFMLWSKYCRADNVERFSERACISGGLGPRFPAVDIMPLALANALRLDKFGA
jgi:2,3-bisphosphoglycerate-independent phosphoglycerate mutase